MFYTPGGIIGNDDARYGNGQILDEPFSPEARKSTMAASHDSLPELIG